MTDGVEKIRALIAAGERLILLRGEEGTGAGLAARIAYEESVIALSASRAASPPLASCRGLDSPGSTPMRRPGGAMGEPGSWRRKGFGRRNHTPSAFSMAGEGVLRLIDVDRVSIGAQDIIERLAQPAHSCAPLGSMTLFAVTTLVDGRDVRRPEP